MSWLFLLFLHQIISQRDFDSAEILGGRRVDEQKEQPKLAVLPLFP
jgi:hypothetical protein